MPDQDSPPPSTAGSVPRVLLLGGTAEARALAAQLVCRGVPVLSSLAGRVGSPRLPEGEVRIGGFGGVPGLVAALHEGAFTHLVDATHPFAVTMRGHAVAAAEEAGVPVLRLARPGWRAHPDAGVWHWVDSYAAARVTAQRLGCRPFVTTGRQTLAHYLSWADRDVLVRVVEPLDEPVPTRWTVLRDRGPYQLDGEVALLREHRIDVLLTKDSGGSYTAAKLTAAAQLAVPVVVVSRPPAPPGLPEVSSIDGVLTWLGVTAGHDRSDAE